jgi:hypothetical protein
LKLETGETRDIVIRNITKPFWNECINKVEQPEMRCRVAAIGTPGIGKTTSTPVLIRMLLEMNKTVVYLVRTLDKSAWNYEFIPKADGSIVTSVYTEKMDRSDILSLELRDTYYIVDPGQTKDSCDPDRLFQPKVIIVASPDPEHWNDREFRKTRDSTKGVLLYYPLWSLDELSDAQATLCPGMEEEKLRERYFLFGGIPRHVFAKGSEEEEELLQKQRDAIRALTEQQVLEIINGEFDAVGNLNPNAPKSAVMGFVQADNDNCFVKRKAVLLSKNVEDRVFPLHMRFLWNHMVSLGDGGRYIFEPYVRDLLVKNPQSSVKLQYREIGKKKKAEQHFLEFRRCEMTRLVSDPVQAVATGGKQHLVLFHSSNSSYPLIDCVYSERKKKVIYHAIQVTTGKDHDAPRQLIAKLEKQLRGKTLQLYYFVPAQNFQTFELNPRNPKVDNNNKKDHLKIGCDIFVVSVPSPNEDNNVTIPSVGGDDKK